ncbi:MAG: hypothetical protein AAFR81_08450 [Chloroflexota bacterium]
MLQSVMMLVSFGLSVWLIIEMWQRFDWFRALVKAIFTYGLGTLAVCTVILFVSLLFFLGWNAFLPLIAYIYGTPVIVLFAVIWGYNKTSSHGDGNVHQRRLHQLGTRKRS